MNMMDIRVRLQDAMEILLVLLARAALGFFLAIVIPMVLYLIAVPIVVSIWAVDTVSFTLMGVLTAGLGGGILAFLSWLDRDRNAVQQLLMLGLVVAAGLVGAWAGYYFSQDVYKMPGLLGIPALVGIFLGATLGANIAGLTPALIKALKNPRL